MPAVGWGRCCSRWSTRRAGFEVAYSRWQVRARDLGTAGGAVWSAPWLSAGRRRVATRELKGHAVPRPTSRADCCGRRISLDVGCTRHLLRAHKGHEAEHSAWANKQVLSCTPTTKFRRAPPRPHRLSTSPPATTIATPTQGSHSWLGPTLPLVGRARRPHRDTRPELTGGARTGGALVVRGGTEARTAPAPDRPGRALVTDPQGPEGDALMGPGQRVRALGPAARSLMFLEHRPVTAGGKSGPRPRGCGRGVGLLLRCAHAPAFRTIFGTDNLPRSPSGGGGPPATDGQTAAAGDRSAGVGGQGTQGRSQASAVRFCR